MENPRPQLSLTELRQLRWLLGGLLAMLSAWTVFYMEVDALFALVVITVTVPVFTLFPRLSSALPPIAHRLAFPVIVVVFALDMWTSREPLPAMIRLDLMLLCYRCIAPRGRREDLQLILLALFLVVVTGVFTVSIAFVAQILVFTAVALALLLAVTLSEARSAGGRSKVAASIDAGWERVRWRELFVRARAATDLRVVGLGAALFAGVVVLSALLFLALPRFEISNDFFLDRLITKNTRTGFSENVSFQDVVDIQQDTSVSLMIDVSDPGAVPAEPYWRMLVLDEYSGRGFRMSGALLSSFVSTREKIHTHAGYGRSRDSDAIWTLYFQPGVSKYLPLAGGFRLLNFGEPQALVQSPALRICSLPVEPVKMVAYRVEGMETDGILRDREFAREGRLLVPSRRMAVEGATEAGPAEADQEPEAREITFLDLGVELESDRRILDEFVRQIGGAGEGGADFARRAGAWLQERHSYSLKMRLEHGEGDPLVRWMASDQPGHCELFAGGLVLLARVAGVPARLVTGFKGGAWNATSGSITVRNSDAHAWVEIWDEEMGSWLRADATPGASITPETGVDPATGAAGLVQDRGWGARIDGLRMFWYRRIVNFDQQSQVQLMRATKDSLRQMVRSAGDTAEQVIRSLLEWARSPWSFSRFAALGLASSALLLGVIFWRRVGRAWWMGWRSRRAASHRQDPVRIEASRWLGRIDRAERLWPASNPEQRAEIDVVRSQLMRLRFGAREAWPVPAAAFRQARKTARSLAVRARGKATGQR